MEHPFNSKAAIITGGSRGIGRAIALRLARDGAAVTISYLQKEAKAKQVVNEITSKGGKAIAIQADIAEPAAVRHLFEKSIQTFGTPDFVIASASQIMLKPLTGCTEEDFDYIFNTNAKGAFFTMREAARRLRDNGRIVVLSTGGTQLFFPEQSLYLGSKGAAEQFARTLAWELAGRGITVNIISPGPTETDMMQDRYRGQAAAKSPFNRIASPEDIADVAAFLVSDEARWVTAQNIGAGGGAF